jgi:hypothetical protein
VETWLRNNWYLVIPWLTAFGAWYVARRREREHPIRWGVVGFLLGGLVVLAFDLAPYIRL